MKKELLRMLSVAVLIAFSCTFGACGDDEDSLNETQQDVMSKLAGTWKRESIYDSSGYPILFACIEVSFTKGGSITVKYINGDNTVKYAVNPITRTETGTYSISADGNSLKSSIWCKLGNELKGNFYISSLSSSTLNIEGVFYKKTSSYSNENDENRNNGNGNSGSGDTGNSGEAPNFLDFSYTYTTNSVTVQFITDTKPTKGTIYYGKTSPTTSVSTTVSGRYISARITGLTKATKYYVKCIATNEYGSTTSDVLSVMTGSN